MRSPVLLFIALVSSLLTSTIDFGAPAAPLDLGRNLTYVRLRHLPDDATTLTTVWTAPALVIDLRHPTGDAAHLLPANLPTRPRTALLLVLVGSGTPVEVLNALRSHAPALLTLGLPATGMTPDIALAVTPEVDRQAYEAFESGTPIDTLISEKNTKPRFAEAELARDPQLRILQKPFSFRKLFGLTNELLEK